MCIHIYIYTHSHLCTCGMDSRNIRNPSDGAHELPATQYLATWQPISLRRDRESNVLLICFDSIRSHGEVNHQSYQSFWVVKHGKTWWNMVKFPWNSTAPKLAGSKSQVSPMVHPHFWQVEVPILAGQSRWNMVIKHGQTSKIHQNLDF